MINYDPHHWKSHLFDIRGSVIREIFARLLVCGAWGALVTLVFVAEEQNWWQLQQLFPWLHPRYLALDPTLHNLLGFAVGLLLVFRTNSSYDRFWEGRKLWGAIVNDSRNLARSSCVHLAENIPLRNAMVQKTIAFAYACMFRLRGRAGVGPVAARLDPTDLVAINQAQHVPLEISCQITALLRRAMKCGELSDYLFVQLDQNVHALVGYLGGCERIHNTPLPYAYIVHLRRVLILYIFTLPFALYGKFGWGTIPAVLFVAFIFLGIEEIGVEIEDPFEGDDNDLPLEDICQTIDANLTALLDAPTVPALLPPPIPHDAVDRIE